MNTLNFMLTIEMEDSDSNEMARLASQLRNELLYLDVEDVGYPTSEAPTGSKSLTAISWGKLWIDIAKSGVVGKVIQTLQAWVQRNHGARIVLNLGDTSLTIENVALNEKQIERFVELVETYSKA